MAKERTLSIIKPDATRRNLTGKVNAKFEEAGLRIVAQRRVQLSADQAGKFYAVHKERPFYNDLVRFMTSGPAVVMAIEGENAIARYREVMGPTDSKKAPEGTIRQRYGTDIERNAVHGSDATSTAKDELAFFFAGQEFASLS